MANRLLQCLVILEPEGDSIENQLNSINRMIATMPSIVTYWYKFSHDGQGHQILVNDEDSMAGHFLHILHGKTPSDLHRRVMDAIFSSYMLSMNLMLQPLLEEFALQLCQIFILV